MEHEEEHTRVLILTAKGTHLHLLLFLSFSQFKHGASLVAKRQQRCVRLQSGLERSASVGTQLLRENKSVLLSWMETKEQISPYKQKKLLLPAQVSPWTERQTAPPSQDSSPPLSHLLPHAETRLSDIISSHLDLCFRDRCRC